MSDAFSPTGSTLFGLGKGWRHSFLFIMMTENNIQASRKEYETATICVSSTCSLARYEFTGQWPSLLTHELKQTWQSWQSKVQADWFRYLCSHIISGSLCTCERGFSLIVCYIKNIFTTALGHQTALSKRKQKPLYLSPKPPDSFDKSSNFTLQIMWDSDLRLLRLVSLFVLVCDFGEWGLLLVHVRTTQHLIQSWI